MKHSGRTISLAPALAASRTLRRAWLRFAALSAPRQHDLLVLVRRGLRAIKHTRCQLYEGELEGLLEKRRHGGDLEFGPV